MTRMKFVTAFAGTMLSAACGTGEERGNTEPPPRPAAITSPIAVELFTSQGCSSCPPADALIAELADEPGVVVITRPVTYWDRLGWRDTLGREENTALQHAYAVMLERGGGRAYTPQAVVAGRIGLVGSRRRELETAIAEAQARPAELTLDVSEAGPGEFRISLDGDLAITASVHLLALDSRETVPIGRGENAGRTVTYTNVVRAESVLGEWRGGPRSFRIGASATAVPYADRYAIVVRRGVAGPIVLARYL